MLRTRRLHAGPAAMRCAPAVVLHRSRRVATAGATFTALQHNCSGKHSRHACLLPSLRRCRRKRYLAFDHPLQEAIREAVAHLPACRRVALRRRYRRLLGAQLCRAALAPGAMPSRASRARREDARYGAAPSRLAAAMTRASGNGVRRAAQRPRADAAPAAATGSPRSAPRASRRSAFAARAGASRSRSPTATPAACIRRPSPCSTSSGCSTRRSARELAAWRAPAIRNYRGIVTGPGRARGGHWRVEPSAAPQLGAAKAGSGVNFPASRRSSDASCRMRCESRRSLVRLGLYCRRTLRPLRFGGRKQRMTQGPPADG